MLGFSWQKGQDSRRGWSHQQTVSPVSNRQPLRFPPSLFSKLWNFIFEDGYFSQPQNLMRLWYSISEVTSLSLFIDSLWAQERYSRNSCIFSVSQRCHRPQQANLILGCLCSKQVPKKCLQVSWCFAQFAFYCFPQQTQSCGNFSAHLSFLHCWFKITNSNWSGLGVTVQLKMVNINILLASENFQEKAASNLRQIWRNQEFTDVTLVSSDGFQLQVHKTVLCSNSSFFRDILIENQHPRILLYMRGVPKKELELLLEFTYTGMCQVEPADQNPSCELAKSLDMKDS